MNVKKKILSKSSNSSNSSNSSKSSNTSNIYLSNTNKDIIKFINKIVPKLAKDIKVFIKNK